MTKHKQPIKRTIQLLFVSILLSALFMSVPPQPARANTYNVTNTSNSGSGSLRQAITDANNNPGPDIITFDAAIDGIPIVLSGAAGEDLNASGDLDILNGGDLTIQGNGAANTIIDGGGIDRIFHNCPGGGCAGTVTLMDLTVRNGSVTNGGGAINNMATLIIQSSTIGGLPVNGNTAVWGGGIYNAAGTTTVDSSTVSANTADYGGGIYNDIPGTLNVQNNSIIGGNTATTDGGGIYNSVGIVTVDGSTVRANDAADGGGIYNWDEGTLNVINSTIGGAASNDANTATDKGGGIYNIGDTTVDGSTVSSNTANYGGGIYNYDTLTVQNGSTIGGVDAGNEATLFGGGIYNSTGSTTVDGSTVSANDAFNGSGIYNLATLNIQNGSTIGGAGAGNGPTNEGGGIYNQIGATTTVDGSTISANSANHGGGILSQGTLTVQNGSTIGGVGAGNTATTNGGGIYILDGTTLLDGSAVIANIAADGGGIYNALNGELTVQNGSVIGGSAVGNLAVANGGGIYNKGQTWVNGSIVRDNTAGGDGGGIYDEGMLAVQNGSTIGGAGAGNTAVGDGGGIYNDALGTTVDASEISANVASSDGGGVYNRAALTVQNGSTIGGSGAGNTAVYNGGGIYNDVTGTTMVTGSRFLSNTATNGGGVFTDRDGSSVTSVTSSCIVGNTTSAFYNNQPATQAAPSNWWGAATGPNTPGADTTVGNVTTSGYLTEPILGCGFYVYLPLIMR